MPDLPAPEAAWKEATRRYVRPQPACRAPSASIIVNVVQLGLLMMPLGRLRPWAGLTSGPTSGTFGSILKAPELSTTTAPCATAIGAHCAAISSGTSNIATATPSKASAATSWTTTSSPRTLRTLPAQRAEARSRISPQTSERWLRMLSMTVPTVPVAPTTARVGLRLLIVRYLHRPRLRRRLSQDQTPCAQRAPRHRAGQPG